jgi:hypothetical protein
MKVMLLAAAATGFAGGASAMPMSNLAAAATANDELKQDVRVVCDRSGRCYNTRRHLYREDYSYNNYGYAPYAHEYNYAPRAYYGSPYGYYGGPGIGLSFGFGGNRW